MLITSLVVGGILYTWLMYSTKKDHICQSISVGIMSNGFLDLPLKVRRDPVHLKPYFISFFYSYIYNTYLIRSFLPYGVEAMEQTFLNSGLFVSSQCFSIVFQVLLCLPFLRLQSTLACHICFTFLQLSIRIICPNHSNCLLST